MCTFILLTSIVGIPSANASLCALQITGTTVTGLGTCTNAVTIPRNITAIGEMAFFNTSSLTSITFEPGSVLTSIGGASFNRSGIRSITIPNSVTSIGPAAFYLAAGLTTVTIPSGVTSIGFNAFNSAGTLTTVRFLGNAPTVDDTSFSSIGFSPIAIVNSDNEVSFTLTTGKWKGFTVQLASAELLATEATAAAESARVIEADRVVIIAAAAAEAAAAESARAVEAARVALENREAKKRQARADLTNISSLLFTLDQFSSAEISGITTTNLARVTAEITELPIESRSDISAVLKIARKFEVVDKVASGGRIDYVMLQEVGLISIGSNHKSALTVVIRKLPEAQRASYELIQVAIADQLIIIQERMDRLVAVRARMNARG